MFTIEVKSKLHIDVVKHKLIHRGCGIQLNIPPFLDKKKYFEENVLPSRQGAQLLTQVLVSALSANIHYCHQNNYRDSAEHLRTIIKSLEEQFIQIAEAIPADYNSKID